MNNERGEKGGRLENGIPLEYARQAKVGALCTEVGTCSIATKGGSARKMQ
jgi:hypothetical protein